MTVTSGSLRSRTDLCAAIENELSGLIGKRAASATAYGATTSWAESSCAPSC